MTEYRPRVVDAELRDRLSVTGAVLVDGPKAVGKTSTASRVAETVLRVDVDRAARAAEAATDVAAESLRRFASKVNTARHGDPLALVVITGGRFVYRRADGVVVVPITALSP